MRGATSTVLLLRFYFGYVDEPLEQEQKQKQGKVCGVLIFVSVAVDSYVTVDSVFSSYVLRISLRSCSVLVDLPKEPDSRAGKC